jgi:hypothetical protein
LQKSYFARKNEPGKKARTKLTQTFAKKLEANFTNLTLPKETQAMKNGLCKMKPPACQNLSENHEANFRDLSKFDTKLFEPKTRTDF